MSIEFVYSLPTSSAFSFGDSADYNGLEDALKNYASRLDTFTESFEFQRTAPGQESYTHNLNIKT